MAADGLPRFLLDLKSEPRGELDGAHHADRVLAEAHVRVADHAHQSLAQIVDAADVVDDREVGDVVEERVDGEVAPPRVLQRRAERVVVGDEQVLGVLGLRGALRLAPERGDLDCHVLKEDVHQPETPADDAAVAEEAPDLHRMRVRGHIEVLRRPVHQQIAHAAAAQVGPIAAAMKTVEDFENVLRDAAAGDRVIGAIDDRRFEVCAFLLGGHESQSAGC